jgi:hypothetical protein
MRWLLILRPVDFTVSSNFQRGGMEESFGLKFTLVCRYPCHIAWVIYANRHDRYSRRRYGHACDVHYELATSWHVLAPLSG